MRIITRRNSSAKSIAISGIFLALTIITLYAESIMPTGKLSLYCLSSFFVSFIIVELGVNAGWLFYIASSLLSFIIIPDKLALMPYFVFFGNYAVIKCYTERTRFRVIEYILKLVFFNLCLILAVYLAKVVFLQTIEVKPPWILVVLGLQIVFVLYDYIFTLVINYYGRRIRSKF